jgi:prolyl-tRNA editing enzyme YbaK/EbsC (Cys-tRNA(Pro) deacylase)
MNPLRALHDLLDQHFPQTVKDEVLCTCGTGNHVRVAFFRVNSQPAAVVLPEGADLMPQHLAEAIGGATVEAIPMTELEATFADTEIGHMQPFENPFGTAVYVDETLLAWKELVFCPRMFSGKRGECFRAATKNFLEVTRAITVPLVSIPIPESDAWAV